jgi:hypothetical protein
MTSANPPREATLRSFSFCNHPREVPVRFRKEVAYRNTTLGFRTCARCRTSRTQ